jgi:predicted DNA-binding transcriptional regulator AlpA
MERLVPRGRDPLALILLPALAEKIGVSRLTLRIWIKEGKLPPPIRITQKVLAWRVEVIEQWLRAKEVSNG